MTFYTADCEPDPDPRDAQIARLTEQVRVAREAMQDADRRLSRPDWTVQRDSARMKLRSALTLMEQNDGQ